MKQIFKVVLEGAAAAAVSLAINFCQRQRRSARVWENYKVETVQLQSQLQKITLRVPTRRNILQHDVIPTVSLDEAVAREGVGSRSRGRRE